MSLTTIYFIKNLDTRRIKIGKSTHVEKRVNILQTTSGCYCELLVYINDVPEYYERALHGMFAKNRYLGEWFKDYHSLIKNFINKLLSQDMKQRQNFLKKKINKFTQLQAKIEEQTQRNEQKHEYALENKRLYNERKQRIDGWGNILNTF